jgi:hypothetical protein
MMDRPMVINVEIRINQVQEMPYDCITNTLITPHREAIRISKSLGLMLSNLNRNKLRRIP